MLMLPALTDKSSVAIYTDASFLQNRNIMYMGGIMITPDGKMHQYSGELKGNEKFRYIKQGAMTAEVLAFMRVLNVAAQKGYTKAYMFYDLEAISMWAKGAYSVNDGLCEMFIGYLRKMSQKIDIVHCLVKHNNDHFLHYSAHVLSQKIRRELQKKKRLKKELKKQRRRERAALPPINEDAAIMDFALRELCLV